MDKYQLYVEIQKHCGIKNGDTVKILRSASKGEMGWDDEWDDEMYECVGKVGVVHGIYDDFIYVHVDDESWSFPFYVLEVVKKHCEIKPFDRVLARNKKDEEWRANFFSHYESGRIYPYICASSTWKYCIPFEGNEHLLGTSDQE